MTPKMWITVVGLGLTMAGTSGFAFTGMQASGSVAENQPAIQRSLDRMDSELDSLKERDSLLAERIDDSEKASKKRHERLTKDLDGLDEDMTLMTDLVRDLCRSDRDCRRRQRLRR